MMMKSNKNSPIVTICTMVLALGFVLMIQLHTTGADLTSDAQRFAKDAKSTIESVTNPELSKQKNSKTKLHIKLISGHNLLAKTRSLFEAKTSDPFVVFKQGFLSVKSATIKNNLNPVWNKEFTIQIGDLSKDLLIEVNDEHIVGSSSLGTATVPLNTVGHEPADYEVKLKGSTGLFGGENEGRLKLMLWITH